jgi:hypothetical protein
MFFRFDRQSTFLAASLALLREGTMTDKRTAMIEITTSSSIKVNALLLQRLIQSLFDKNDVTSPPRVEPDGFRAITGGKNMKNIS